MLDMFLIVLVIVAVVLYSAWSIGKIFFSKNGTISCCSTSKKSAGCTNCPKQ